ncbi:MAG: hypothetical protein WD468_12330 [Pirellulales bacterium]
MNRYPCQIVRLLCALAAFSLTGLPDAQAVKVWESTFDSTTDGVVDIADNNFSKVMIGPVADGRLQITAADPGGGDAYNPDKAGRPLPVPLEDGNDSMSGQFKFRWSQLNSDEGQAWSFAGFLGDTIAAQTRQIAGAIIRHWQVTGTEEHYVAIDLAFGSVGFTNDFGYKAGDTLYIGNNPTDQDFELQVEYDGSTHVLGVDLLNSAGTVLRSKVLDVDTELYVGPSFTTTPGQIAQELDSLRLSHLGWGDYSGTLANRQTVWQVDSLAYYDEPQVPGTFIADADYNNDGTVNAADYVVWKHNFGNTGTPGSLAGDGTSNDLLGVPDGDVDQFDYDFWKARFGDTVAIGTVELATGSTTIPEPTSAVLIIGAVLGLLPWRRNGR